MQRPGRVEFARLAGAGNLVPVVREAMGDLETPISLYRKLRPLGACYLLESAEQGSRFGRYSFIGVGRLLRFEADAHGVTIEGPQETRREAGPPLAALRQVMRRFRVSHPGVALPRFYGGAVGFFSYDLVNSLERLPQPRLRDVDWPVASFVISASVVVIDHLTHRVQLVHNSLVDGDAAKAYELATAALDRLEAAIEGPAPESEPRAGAPSGASAVRANLDRAAYGDMVRAAKRYIRAGDIFQAVLSQRLERRTAASPLDIYRSLRSLNPSPYMFLLELGGVTLAGASPEMLVRVESGLVETRPIAGTRPRGGDDAEDQRLAAELLADPKERAEHVMLVDLGRNDIGRVAAAGSVEVPELMVVERYSHVMHIVSSVRGRLRADRDAFDALGACFPAGTLSGAPKVRAMEIIAEQEPVARGPYGGCVGYFGWDGNMDTCITIRTVALKDGRAYVQAGAGLVADSDPDREYQECLHKAEAVLRALERAEGLAPRMGG